jgi:AbrB family looped-hinge helix DNA binding protein
MIAERLHNKSGRLEGCNGLTLSSTTVLYNYMKTPTERDQAMSAVKIGVSRQVAIPKKLHDQLGLSAGDYLEIEVRGGKLILTPKQLIDKRLDEAEDDVRRGRVLGPFNTAKQAMKALRTRPR